MHHVVNAHCRIEETPKIDGQLWTRQKVHEFTKSRNNFPLDQKLFECLNNFDWSLSDYTENQLKCEGWAGHFEIMIILLLFKHSMVYISNACGGVRVFNARIYWLSLDMMNKPWFYLKDKVMIICNHIESYPHTPVTFEPSPFLIIMVHCMITPE